MTNQQAKAREIKLRRAATRQGLALIKNRRRDPLALGYGRYRLNNARGRTVAGTDRHGVEVFDLDDVERYLTSRQVL